MKRYFFRDKACESNLQDGRDHHAAGVVIEHLKKSPSGKELTVYFLDPFTVTIESQWRSYDDVVLFEADDSEWQLALEKYKTFHNQT